jgi:hypothetical protein
MDEFVSKTLKKLGKDFFLTQFSVNNPTNAPIVFDLFDSNSNVNVPTSVLAPTVPSTLYSFAGIPYGMDINSSNNTLYVVDGTNNVLIFSLSTYALINTLTGGVGGQYTAITYDSVNNTMLITSVANPLGIVELNCSTNTFTNQVLPSGLTITELIAQQPNYYNSVFNPSNQNLYIPTQSTTSPTRFLTKYNSQTNSYGSNINLGNIPVPNQLSIPFSTPSLTNDGGVIVNNLMYIYVNSGIEIYNLNNSTLITTIPFPIGVSSAGNITPMVYCPSNNSIYISVFVLALSNISQILILDCSSNTFSGYVDTQSSVIPNSFFYSSSNPMPNAISNSAMYWSPVNDTVWVGNINSLAPFFTIEVWQLNFPSAPTLITTLTGSATYSSIFYSLISNTMCCMVGTDMQVYNASTFALITTVINVATIGVGGNNMAYRLTNNSMYVIDGFVVRVFDCFTNTVVATINPALGSLNELQYNPNNDCLYGTDNSSNIVFCYDFATTTFSYITIPLPADKMGFSITQNKLYVGEIAFASSIYIIDTTTNTFISTIAIPISSSVIRDIEYDQLHDIIYYSTNNGGQNYIISLNCQYDINFGFFPSTTGTINKIIYIYNGLNIPNQNRLCSAVGNQFYVSNSEATFSSSIYNPSNNSIYSFTQFAFGANNLNPNSFEYEYYYISEINCSTNTINQYWTGLYYIQSSNILNKYNTISYNASLNIIYIPSFLNIIKRFDCSTNQPLIDLTSPLNSISNVPLFLSGMDCICIGNIVYFVYNYQLFNLDCTTNIFSLPINLGSVNYQTQCLSYNSLDNLIYILFYDNSFFNFYLVTYSINTNSVVGNIYVNIVFFSQQPQILYYPIGNSLWINDQQGYIQNLYNPNGQFATYCPSNNCIYLGSNNNSNQVRVYDCSTDLLVATITTNANPIQCAYNTLTNEMYVTCSTGFVDVINCSTNTIVTSLSIPTSSPYSVAYNSQLNLMYVTDIANNSVINIDCS